MVIVHTHTHILSLLCLDTSIPTHPPSHTHYISLSHLLSYSFSLYHIPYPHKSFTQRSQWQPKVWWRLSSALIRHDWKLWNSFFFSFLVAKKKNVSISFSQRKKIFWLFFQKNLQILCSFSFKEIESVFVLRFEIFNYFLRSEKKIPFQFCH